MGAGGTVLEAWAQELCPHLHQMRIKATFSLPNSISVFFIQLRWAEKVKILASNTRRHPSWRSLFLFCLPQIYMEKAMAPHSSTLAWKIPWAEEPGGLQSMGSRRVGHDWATSLSLFTFMHWRRKWQPTPVFLPGESQGRGSLVGCHLWVTQSLTWLKWLSSSSISTSPWKKASKRKAASKDLVWGEGQRIEHHSLSTERSSFCGPASLSFISWRSWAPFSSSGPPCTSFLGLPPGLPTAVPLHRLVLCSEVPGFYFLIRIPF